MSCCDFITMLWRCDSDVSSGICFPFPPTRRRLSDYAEIKAVAPCQFSSLVTQLLFFFVGWTKRFKVITVEPVIELLLYSLIEFRLYRSCSQNEASRLWNRCFRTQWEDRRVCGMGNGKGRYIYEELISFPFASNCRFVICWFFFLLSSGKTTRIRYCN